MVCAFESLIGVYIGLGFGGVCASLGFHEESQGFRVLEGVFLEGFSRMRASSLPG
jgi:hypothetical protein